MKRILTITPIWLALSAIANASVPQSPNMNEYRSLLSRSAFIIKKPPVVEERKPVNNSLKLRGVSKFKGGWIATLYDRKKPKENIILEEGASARDGLKLISVSQRKGNYEATTVVVLSGGRQVTVGFDTEAIKRSYGKAKQPVKSTRQTRPKVNRTPAKATNTTPKKPTTGRRPRVRRVKTPTVK